MKAEGIDIVSLAAGEPDFPTPEVICNAAKQALDEGFTRYAPTPGLPGLRQLISEKLTKENHIAVTPANIVVSCGAKHSLYNAMQVLLDPGDEVIVFSPCWMTYLEQIRLAGAVPVEVKTTAESGFCPTLDDLKLSITPRTKAIIINSPSNPTGAVLSRQSLKEIAAVALRHELWVISDEIYEKLIYDVEHVSIASLGKEIAEQTITIGGCSKTYAMTGWRIGFMAAPLEVAKAVSNLQDQVTSNAVTFAQKGAIAALKMPDSEIEKVRQSFQRRRDLILSLLNEIPDVTTSKPDGAFYVMPDISAYYNDRIKDDCKMADYLLEEAKVAVVPGSVFGGAGHVRLSYAASEKNISEGVTRIAAALQLLRA
jgi:aspartate aminotransferase